MKEAGPAEISLPAESRPCGLEICGLSKAYAGGTSAVSRVSHAFAPGKVTAILGPSGSGKSTTLGMVAGLLTPDSGRVVLDGTDITGLPAEKRNFGMVFQNYALFPHLTVLENVAFGLRVRGVEEAERRLRAAEMLELVRIPHLAGRRPAQLSGGEQQRVALARALAFRPRVLLMDEPLSALDAKLREELRSELARLLRDLALTTLYVTHDQTEAMALGHELLIMNGGRIEQSGSPGEIYRAPRSPFVAGFIGSANVFASVQFGAGVIELPFASLSLPGRTLSGAHWAMLRPEAFEIASGGGPADFTAQVESALFLGAQTRLELRAGETRLIADIPAGTAVALGSAVRFRVKPDQLYLASFEA